LNLEKCEAQGKLNINGIYKSIVSSKGWRPIIKEWRVNGVARLRFMMKSIGGKLMAGVPTDTVRTIGRG
jgi:hypothetical protein